jgi:hypothetical protein
MTNAPTGWSPAYLFNSLACLEAQVDRRYLTLYIVDDQMVVADVCHLLTIRRDSHPIGV